MSDAELEERLTVAAAAPGNRLTRVYGQLLGERQARIEPGTALRGA